MSDIDAAALLTTMGFFGLSIIPLADGENLSIFGLQYLSREKKRAFLKLAKQHKAKIIEEIERQSFQLICEELEGFNVVQ